MIRLYLIRHGETDWNKQKKFQGWTDIDLNENGKMQAELLGERFKDIKVDEIYSSPLQRSVNTAKPIAQIKNLSIIENENFKEINFGEWEGLTVSEIYEKAGEDFVTFMKKPEEGTFPGDGSFANVTKRIAEGLEEVLDGKEDKNIVIVSHGGIVRLTISYLMNFPGDWYNKTWIDNTSVSVIELSKNRGNLLRVLNDFSHINSDIL